MLRLNVGVSRKVGLPDYCSAGASCNIEVELACELLRHDPNGFREQVRHTYVMARQAVNDELARLQGQAGIPAATPATSSNGHAPRNGSDARANAPRATTGGSVGRAFKPATPSQVKAIYAIAQRRRADLDDLLRDGFAVERPEDLSLPQASAFIDRLKAGAEV